VEKDKSKKKAIILIVLVDKQYRQATPIQEEEKKNRFSSFDK
jgi:hypothetical protein